MTKRKSGAAFSIIGTTPENIELHRSIMEMRYGHGMQVNNIAKFIGMTHQYVGLVLKKYKPIEGDKDITMTIRSKV